MTSSSYDPIAGWYDERVRTDPFYREMVVPSMLLMAGDALGLAICDVACGQGMISREFARAGAHVTGIDISLALLDMARGYEALESLGIDYREDDAQTLSTIPDGSCDGATCGMALMNIPDLSACAQSVRRVLKQGGWFVASITHPCFQTPDASWVTRDDGSPAREVAGYFNEGYWTSPNVDSVRAQIGEHHRMLSTYVDAFAGAGFLLQRMHEPQASGDRLKQTPGNREVPSILTLRFVAM